MNIKQFLLKLYPDANPSFDVNHDNSHHIVLNEEDISKGFRYLITGNTLYCVDLYNYKWMQEYSLDFIESL